MIDVILGPLAIGIIFACGLLIIPIYYEDGASSGAFKLVLYGLGGGATLLFIALILAHSSV